MSSLPHCPLCKAPPENQTVVVNQVFGDSTGRSVFHCSQCDVRYLFPGLSPEEEHKLYSAEFEKFMTSRSAPGAGWEKPESHIAANEGQRQRRMKYLKPLLKPNFNILEIGCGSGFMLYPLVEQGHTCIGIEPSGVFSDYVRNRGITCYDSVSAMMQQKPGIKFDLIFHYYVLEHIAGAVDFLKSQLDLLNPGGHIVFEVPHANDALTAVYKIPAYDKFIWVVSHCWYFSKTSLQRAVAMAGGQSKILYDQRYDLSNHLVWARDGKPGGMGRFTEALGQDLEEHYKQALIKAEYADTLIGIVTK